MERLLALGRGADTGGILHPRNPSAEGTVWNAPTRANFLRKRFPHSDTGGWRVKCTFGAQPADIEARPAKGSHEALALKMLSPCTRLLFGFVAQHTFSNVRSAGEVTRQSGPGCSHALRILGNTSLFFLILNAANNLEKDTLN
jgi:hypothetical protein